MCLSRGLKEGVKKLSHWAVSSVSPENMEEGPGLARASTESERSNRTFLASLRPRRPRGHQLVASARRGGARIAPLSKLERSPSVKPWRLNEGLVAKWVGDPDLEKGGSRTDGPNAASSSAQRTRRSAISRAAIFLGTQSKVVEDYVCSFAISKEHAESLSRRPFSLPRRLCGPLRSGRCSWSGSARFRRRKDQARNVTSESRSGHPGQSPR